jgi:DNA repair protein RecO (recombination protein O)
MALYREQGIVLRTYKLGETDRIVNLLTPNRGLVRAVAKGVRRPGSRFGGRLEPYSHVDIQLYEGRNLDMVSQVELISPFARVREEYALSACGSAMVEAADRVAQPDEHSARLFLLLRDGLRALAARPSLPAVVLDAYLLRLASIAGYHPYLEACAGCGETGPHGVFHIGAGGTLCPDCAPAGSQVHEPGVISLLGTLATGGWEALDAAAGDPRTRRVAAHLVASFFTHHLGRPLRAWDLVPR